MTRDAPRAPAGRWRIAASRGPGAGRSASSRPRPAAGTRLGIRHQRILIRLLPVDRREQPGELVQLGVHRRQGRLTRGQPLEEPRQVAADRLGLPERCAPPARSSRPPPRARLPPLGLTAASSSFRFFSSLFCLFDFGLASISPPARTGTMEIPNRNQTRVRAAVRWPPDRSCRRFVSEGLRVLREPPRGRTPGPRSARRWRRPGRAPGGA